MYLHILLISFFEYCPLEPVWILLVLQTHIDGTEVNFTARSAGLNIIFNSKEEGILSLIIVLRSGMIGRDLILR